MALVEPALPYGMRDCKLTSYTDAAGTVLAGTSVDLPNSRTFSWTEAEDFEELRGDDRVVTRRGKGPGVNWELESGGISLDAYLVMNGGTNTTTGVTPNIKKTYQKKDTDVKPWFKVESQAISDSGGDFHAIVWKCRASGDLKGAMGDGTFLLTNASGTAIGRSSDGAIYDLVMNETTTAIP